MEDLKSYIETGVLELYVLGDLSSDERQEVELMVSKYPELKHELDEIEKSMRIYAEKHEIEPHPHLRNKILDTLDYKDEVSLKALHTENGSVRSGNFYKYAFAASIALLMISAAVMINMSNQLKESYQRIASLEISNQKFSNRVNYINQQLSSSRQSLEVYRNPKDYLLVELKGLPKAPEAKMVVAFNAAKEEVMIDMASLKMPENDELHQYQLWALVDGKPVDLGVFDKKTDSSTGMIKMKAIKKAQAFAVTLEPKGGNVSPTLDKMMVMGSI